MLRTDTCDRTIAMSVIRMVIYHKALTGSPCSPNPLLPPLLRSPQSSLIRIPTSSVRTESLPSYYPTFLIVFADITTLTSYFSMLEAGLGLCAACLPVQYGLLHSEKVRSILRTIYSLASLGSPHGSHYSHESRGSRRSRKSHHLHDPWQITDNGSQSSEANIPLPAHAAVAAGQARSPSELELGNMRDPDKILVTKNFDMT